MVLVTVTILFSTVVKGNLPTQKRRDVTYRINKTFDIDEFTYDLQKIKISENCTEKDLNSIYDDYEEDLKKKHAPVKSRGQRNKPLPCMNKELRGAIYRKQMLYSQYTKNRSDKNWEKFRKQRNLVTKIKRKSIKRTRPTSGHSTKKDEKQEQKSRELNIGDEWQLIIVNL
ncbi:unnamed protein product [Mytilus edulis]|uniref:Uncharacterized protein n=1 Tax=Mytilus edulis TaxID=6550 RepID=A0A8S3UF50_MYTED|nr:unnamed protein product [Mytilus edulis]